MYQVAYEIAIKYFIHSFQDAIREQRLLTDGTMIHKRKASAGRVCLRDAHDVLDREQRLPTVGTTIHKRNASAGRVCLRDAHAAQDR